MSLADSAQPARGGAERITAIDAHAHVFARGLPLAPRRRHAPQYDALLADYVDHLDRHAISHAVLVQPSFLGTDNSYLIDAVRSSPQRLRGVIVAEPDIAEDALAALAAQGAVGIRLNLVGLEIPDFAAPPWQALLAHVRALGWHVEVHREARDLPPILDALLASRCNLVVDHFGRPDPKLGVDDPGFAALLRAADSGRVWVKLSAAYRSAQSLRLAPADRSASGAEQDAEAAQAAASALLGAFGPERLVWGSDWPHTQHEDSIDFARSRALLDAWVPSDAQRQRILVDTPAVLFGFR